MQSPMVSIIMPVYNSAPYLREAIDSMLAQSFADFELIIVNDGSTDSSEQIISSYMDDRIKYIKNESNSGLVYTLNKGLDHAQGKFIARMDGDDIALPNRLKSQLDYLDANSEATVVATVVKLIDDNGSDIGFWEDDRIHVSKDQIRGFLPRNNCVAHPTILGWANILKKYQYSVKQSQAEDYDLWLRLVSDNKEIHKIPEPLLLHRILPKSYTRTRQQNVFSKLGKTKRIFFWESLKAGKLNSFVFIVGWRGLIDTFKGVLKGTKQKIQS